MRRPSRFFSHLFPTPNRTVVLEYPNFLPVCRLWISLPRLGLVSSARRLALHNPAAKPTGLSGLHVENMENRHVPRDASAGFPAYPVPHNPVLENCARLSPAPVWVFPIMYTFPLPSTATTDFVFILNNAFPVAVLPAARRKGPHCLHAPIFIEKDPLFRRGFFRSPSLYLYNWKHHHRARFAVLCSLV